MPTSFMKAWQCNRCLYEWPNRDEDKPVRCANPKCNSPYWDKPRQNKENENAIDRSTSEV